MSMHRTTMYLAVLLLVAGCIGVLVWLRAPVALRADAARRSVYYVSPAGDDRNRGSDAKQPLATIQKALDLAQPGDQIELAPGDYFQDVISVRSGSSSMPIQIKGPPEAVLKGAGTSSRIFEINHDYLTLDGFTIDGLWSSPSAIEGFREKLLYVVGRQPNRGVTGLKVLHMTFRNAGGECLRLRYFAQHNEIGYSHFNDCGVHDFKFGAGKRNGEAIYIGTAPEQRANGENPTSAPDESNENWIHDNIFNTQGNECVDIKESSSGNLVERNSCTGQQDPNSAGFDARGNRNIFRQNQSFGNRGAGIRLGGDLASDGLDNQVYDNQFYDNQAGGIKLVRQRQQLCGNQLRNNRAGKLVGAGRAKLDPERPCDGALR